MKKIYPVEWMELHGYTQVDSVDRYYTDIANRIYRVFLAHPDEWVMEYDEDIRYVSLCLAAWFEDVISQTGIWTTFTAECKKRYGKWLPFYPLDDDYYPDEINVEDVRFLLWHHAQTYCREEGRILNPENPAIEMLAHKIYDILDEVYETAPENEKLWEFMHPSEQGIAGFDEYRNVLEWFHYKAYFNIENEEQYWDEVDDMEDESATGNPETQSLFQYGIKNSLLLNGRRDLLSLPSNEWLALWAERNEGPEEWLNAKEKVESWFLLTGEDGDYFYLTDLCSKDEKTYKAVRESFRMSDIRHREIGKSVFFATLLHYGDYWYQMGVLVMYQQDDKIMEMVHDMQQQRAHINEKAVFEDFMKATGGKPFHFCKSRQDMVDFFVHDLKYNMSEGLQLPKMGDSHGMVLMVSPRTGLHVQTRLCECIKSPDNAFYDAESAARQAHSFFFSPDVVPYDLSCVLQDMGMLPDAKLSSLKGEEYGRNFLRQNARFLTDYFFHRCREKDYSDESGD